jgi:hypothetical protein
MSPDKNRDVFESGDEGEEKQLSPLLESLARGDKNAANMVLAYEISVNDQFELNSTPPKNSVQGYFFQIIIIKFIQIKEFQKSKMGIDVFDPS